MDLDARFNQLRMNAACVQLNREEISELIGITAELLDERRRLRLCLQRLPESFGEVRKLLNELSRIVNR